MEIRAAEISAILKQQIANFGSEADVAEVGQVLSIGDGIARVYGLDTVQAGVFRTRYKGVPFIKSPFDIGIYLQLLSRQRPRTVIEVGAKRHQRP